LIPFHRQIFVDPRENLLSEEHESLLVSFSDDQNPSLLQIKIILFDRNGFTDPTAGVVEQRKEQKIPHRFGIGRLEGEQGLNFIPGKDRRKTIPCLPLDDEGKGVGVHPFLLQEIVVKGSGAADHPIHARLRKAPGFAEVFHIQPAVFQRGFFKCDPLLPPKGEQLHQITPIRDDRVFTEVANGGQIPEILFDELFLYHPVHYTTTG